MDTVVCLVATELKGFWYDSCYRGPSDFLTIPFFFPPLFLSNAAKQPFILHLVGSPQSLITVKPPRTSFLRYRIISFLLLSSSDLLFTLPPSVLISVQSLRRLLLFFRSTFLFLPDYKLGDRHQQPNRQLCVLYIYKRPVFARPLFILRSSLSAVACNYRREMRAPRGKSPLMLASSIAKCSVATRARIQRLLFPGNILPAESVPFPSCSRHTASEIDSVGTVLRLQTAAHHASRHSCYHPVLLFFFLR